MIEQTNVPICMFSSIRFYADLQENFLTTRICHLATDNFASPYELAAYKIKQLN